MISVVPVIEAVEKYLHGPGSGISIACEFGIKSTFQQWIANISDKKNDLTALFIFVKIM